MRSCDRARRDANGSASGQRRSHHFGQTNPTGESPMITGLLLTGFRPRAQPVKTSLPTLRGRELLEHLVGAAEQRERHGEAQRPGGLEVDEQLDLGRLLHRQVGRLVALENPAAVDTDLTVRVRQTAAIAHQAAGGGKLAVLEDRGHRVADRQCGELLAPAIEQSIIADRQRACPQSGQGCEDRIEVAFGARLQDMGLQPDRAGRRLQLSRLGLGIGPVGLTRSAMVLAVGTSSCSSSKRFGPSSTVRSLTPVRLPPGRFRLATSPDPTGSLPTMNTTGVVVVAALAARAAETPLTAITLT